MKSEFVRFDPEQFKKLLCALDRFSAATEHIATALESVASHNKIQIQFKGAKPGMPGQETDIQTIPATAIETDDQNNPVTIDPNNATWAVDDPTIAQLTQNPDGSATFKALKIGVTGVSLTDNATSAKGTETLEVVAHPRNPNKLVINFGVAA